MNLWILNHYAVTPDLPGGTRHYDLGKELVKRGHDVTIFASGFHHYSCQETKLAPSERWKIENVDGVKFVWLETFPYQRNDWRRVLSMVSYMLRAWWLGRRLPRFDSQIEKPNVIIGSSVHLLAVLAAYWVTKRYRARFIMEVRDLWPQTMIDMGVLSARNPITKGLQYLERFLYRRALQIIVIPPRAGEYISALGIDREKIHWIPNGVDLSRYIEAVPPQERGDAFTVMYTGSHGPANGLHILLEAARLLQVDGFSDIQVVFVGDGPEKPRLLALKVQWRLKNVEFRPAVAKEGMPGLLAEADVCIVDTDAYVPQYGTSPNKLPDYLAAGKPFIVLSDQPQDAPSCGCGLQVPALDAQRLAEAVIMLYRMPAEELRAIGMRGRQYAAEHYDITRIAEQLVGYL